MSSFSLNMIHFNQLAACFVIQTFNQLTNCHVIVTLDQLTQFIISEVMTFLLWTCLLWIFILMCLLLPTTLITIAYIRPPYYCFTLNAVKVNYFLHSSHHLFFLLRTFKHIKALVEHVCSTSLTIQLFRQKIWVVA